MRKVESHYIFVSYIRERIFFKILSLIFHSPKICGWMDILCRRSRLNAGACADLLLQYKSGQTRNSSWNGKDKSARDSSDRRVAYVFACGATCRRPTNHFSALSQVVAIFGHVCTLYSVGWFLDRATDQAANKKPKVQKVTKMTGLCYL